MKPTNMDYVHLLNRYRQVWNNRQLPGINEEETLREAIRRDLTDENSHPRVRRPLHEKYFMATRRIAESSLTDEDKVKLIQLHASLCTEMQ
ncbi:hypothetical protein [Mesobacillus foraminis]|nr:hypothetical protein [Mesobacillus foraminis]